MPSYWLACGLLALLGLYFRRPLGVCVARVRRLPETAASIQHHISRRYEADGGELQGLRAADALADENAEVAPTPKGVGVVRSGGTSSSGSASVLRRGSSAAAGGALVVAAELALSDLDDASAAGGWDHDIDPLDSSTTDGWGDKWGDDDGWDQPKLPDLSSGGGNK